MFELTVERHFAAAHSLENYPGPCARLHGHNYRVIVSFRGHKLDANGFLVDFAALKEICATAVEPLDHQYLNKLPAFEGRNPTAEHLAEYLYQQVQKAAAQLPVQVSSITVYESDTSAVTYRED